jgi:heterodisulfide reductase subunit A
VKISTSQGAETIEAGALLIATGAGPYEPEDYGYGQSDSVLTQKGFGARVAKGEKPWKKVVMIQCVGARDAEHPYCSRFCCRQALTNALRYKESDPEAEITILHRGIRTFGIEEELYTDAEESGIALVQIEGRPNVTTGGSLCVKAGRTDGGPLDLQCDAVVLSVAHHHGEEQTALASIAGVPLDELGFVATVNPMDSPFETAVPGVFVCGFARSPVIAEDAFVEGVGAAGEVCRYIRA